MRRIFNQSYMDFSILRLFCCILCSHNCRDVPKWLADDVKYMYSYFLIIRFNFVFKRRAQKFDGLRTKTLRSLSLRFHFLGTMPERFVYHDSTLRIECFRNRRRSVALHCGTYWSRRYVFLRKATFCPRGYIRQSRTIFLIKVALRCARLLSGQAFGSVRPKEMPSIGEN